MTDLRALPTRAADPGPATDHLDDEPARTDRTRPAAGDLPWGVLAVLLVATASLVGVRESAAGAKLFVAAPPLFAQWMPHVGPGSVPAVALAGCGVLGAQRLARRLRWRPMLAVGWLLAVCWTFSLALIDGWQRGVAARLEDVNEYLHEIPRITDVGAFLSTFTDHILDFQPGRWTTHVSSHPPLATLFFVTLDRIGLGGGGWAGVAMIAVGSLAAVAVPVTLRALGAYRAARASWPFMVFFPGAVWVGVSADGMFLGVSAVGIALLTLGITHRRSWPGVLLATAGGLLLGATLYLSYGLALLGIVVAAIAVLTAVRAGRSPGRDNLATPGRDNLATPGWGWAMRWAAAVFGVLAVVVIFTAAGFSWTEGLSLLHTRYYQGIASQRPYRYFVWANLAALCVAAGPGAAIAVSRSVATLWRARTGRLRRSAFRAALRPARDALVPAALCAAALVAVLAADLTGMSKAETERIWLPFGIWLMCGLGLLPRRQARWVLAAQLTTALLVNHLMLTHW